MGLNHFETGEFEINGDAMHRRRSIRSRLNRFRNPQSAIRIGFTLTELLVVVTIIAILAGLITGAAINALNKAKQARITMEAQQLGIAMEDFKNDFGAYPPNVFSNPDSGLSNQEQHANARTLQRFMRKAFSRGSEFAIDLSNNTPTRNNTPQNDNLFPICDHGMSPAEALVFWLQGFSSDPARPLSGTDLVATRIDDNGTFVDNVITIDAYQPRFDFDKGRLRISRDNSDPPQRRRLTVYRVGDNTEYQIQLYEYLPAGSNEPYVYFDTSRETPLQVTQNWQTTEFFYSSPRADASDPQLIFPLKQFKQNVPQQSDQVTPVLQYLEYVEQGKFQILHCGLDDIWGNFSDAGSGGQLNVNDEDFVPQLLFPEGPFIGDIGDTLGSFITGTLEAEQE